MSRHSCQEEGAKGALFHAHHCLSRSSSCLIKRSSTHADIEAQGAACMNAYMHTNAGGGGEEVAWVGKGKGSVGRWVGGGVGWERKV